MAGAWGRVGHVLADSRAYKLYHATMYYVMRPAVRGTNSKLSRARPRRRQSVALYFFFTGKTVEASDSFPAYNI